MSTAIRHAMAWNKDEEGCTYVFSVQQADGNWIKWEDYAKLKAEVERLAMAGSQSIAVGSKLREMVGDHHWSLEFDRVRTDWYHASRGILSRHQDPNTPPTAV